MSDGTTMTRGQVEQVVQKLLVEEFDIEPNHLRPDTTMESLDLDSLDLVEIAQVVQKRYGVRIRAEDAGGVKTLGEVVDLVMVKLETARSPAASETTTQ